jgi:two-component system, OmpR family, response regulator
MLETPADRSLSVLLVEDSKVLAERLSEMLSGISGLALTAVVDTEAAALGVVEEGAIDVVLLDLHLRQGTGFGVLRGLTRHAKRPVVVVLTNYDLAEYRRTATALGAEYFLDKVRDVDQLPDVMDKIRAALN